MIHKETVEAFIQEYKNCGMAISPFYGNGLTRFWYPHIPDGAKLSIRSNFNLAIDEEILFFRDTSFWNRRNQGIVITDCKIAAIYGDDIPDDILPWGEIKNVEYDANCLNVFGYEGRDDVTILPIELFADNLVIKTVKSFGSKLAQMLTNVAETQQGNSLDDVRKTFETLVNEGKEEEALQYALEYRAQDKYNVELSTNIADIYEKRGQLDIALRLLNEDIDNICDTEVENETAKFWLWVLRASRCEISEEVGNKVLARADSLYVMNNMPTEGVSPEDYNEMEGGFKEIEDDFVEHFFEIPYQKRKTLVPVKSYSGIDLTENTLQVISTDHLPEIEFPIGHPIANQLYVGHPYLPHKYIPFENYELEFVEDRIREFCQIMQFLGATEINIESVNSSDSKSDVNVHDKKGVEGDYECGAVSASAKSESDSGSRLLETISRSIQLHQIYHPKKSPKLPPDTVWFNNEPSWQRTYKQRMQGSLLEHEERIETKKSRVVNGTELKTLSAEFQSLLLDAGGQWEQSMEEQFETQENVILSIKVKFAPLESLQSENGSVSAQIAEPSKDKISNNEEYTAAEKEYIEEVKACLEETLEISSGERRLLDRLRKKLGISEERASELEAALQTPQLSEEEEEYMGEVKACFEESAEISSGERRLLNRMRDKLGISEERAIEIEKKCKKLK